MRNSLYITTLSLFLASCATQKTVPKVAAIPKWAPAAPAPKPAAPQKQVVSQQNGAEFFTTNISDPTKNDNTASYGSIVSAKPTGFHVVKTYFPSVAQNFRQRFIVLHYTGIDNEKSIRVLTQQTVSVHYLVNDLPDNEIYQLVDENKRAYHAGISSWRGTQSLNDTSIGIEIVNVSTDIPGGYDFKPYPDYQIKKVAMLVKDLAARYQIPPQNIIGHSDIAPTRKEDPGPQFPWKKLYTDYQIGMWYDDATKQNIQNQMSPEDFAAQVSSPSFIFKYQNMLKDFGYGLDPSGTVDVPTKKTITAFQYHFRPENYSGVMDAETFAILQALLQKYPK